MAGIGLIGLGRVGRTLLRVLAKRGWEMEVAAATEINPANRPPDELTANLAYLLANDSTYGPFPGRVGASGGSLLLDGREVPVIYTPDPREVDWAGLGARIVVEASGARPAMAAAAELPAAGVSKVVATRCFEAAGATLIRGFNLDSYHPATHHLVSSGTCTANALVPVLSLLHGEYGVSWGSVTTIHPALSGDPLLDSPAGQFSAGRAGLGVRPVKSRVAVNAMRLIPGLAGRLTGMSFRVPTLAVNALVADLVLERPPNDLQDLIQCLERAEAGPLAGVVGLERGFLGHPRVAMDFLGDPRSALLDLNWLELAGPLLRLVLWHDNEYGYCCRVADVLEVIARRL